ncbi:hypothetical protein HUF15_15190 [Streptomyces samsunensis]|nr:MULTISPECIES: hypothetical protein [Streptomyces]MCD9594270.1 hypothetical protein [Streptomyces sp. 8ZJF_21]MCM3808979.1 hypothetical protein [Streptomyces sp. DR7-3]MCQ6250289.1 hypothetical protein [Streptomyces malaysiensis]NUH38096.1 hypothetical protein [Streptomyces samsunensis]WHX24325.1 hypothetical protein QFW82_32340 [Streptomyces sp. NA07423]
MALFRRGTAGKPGEWYYCIKHQKVEEGPECRAADRLGPYASPEEAARAMETARERNEEWRNDPRWRDDEPQGGDA